MKSSNSSEPRPILDRNKTDIEITVSTSVYRQDVYLHGLHIGYLMRQSKTDIWSFVLCPNCGDPFACLLWQTSDLALFSLLVDCAVVSNYNGLQQSYRAVYETVSSSLGALLNVINEEYPELFDGGFLQDDMVFLKLDKDGHFFKPLQLVETKEN